MFVVVACVANAEVVAYADKSTEPPLAMLAINVLTCDSVVKLPDELLNAFILESYTRMSPFCTLFKLISGVGLFVTAPLNALIANCISPLY